MMWAQAVVNGQPEVEASLHGGAIVGRKLVKNFCLEGAIEAFVFALSLRMVGRAVVNTDAQQHEPDGEFSIEAHSAAPAGTVVHEHGVWDAVRTHGEGKFGADGVSSLVKTGEDSRGKAGVVVDESEGMAEGAVSEGEVALEIHLPESVGGIFFKAKPGAMSAGSGGIDASVAFENGGESAVRGELEVTEILEAAAEFARSPGGMFVAQSEDELFHVWRAASWRGEGFSGAVSEGIGPRREKEFKEAVACVATDVELAAKSRDVGTRLNGGCDEGETLRQD